MSDLLLCALPKQGVNVPPLALAYLQGVCKSYGINVEVRDLNIELWEDTVHTEWWEMWKESDQTMYKGKEFENFYNSYYKDVIEKWGKELAEHPAQFIGLSAFSYRSLPTLKYLTPAIKKHNPDKIIIVGGSPVATYKDWILKNKLADYAVSNEGDIALPEIVLGHHKPGSIALPQIQDLNVLAKPDYTGLDFDRYVPGDPAGSKVRNTNYKRKRYEAGIVGSRGCVRRCTFCDVETFWPRFRWRSAEHIYAEMQDLYNQGIDHLYFFDSLLNGNQKEFEKLLDIIIENGSVFKSIKGLAIIKKQPERIYKKMSLANIKQLSIGIESFSPKLRQDMNKGFDDETLKQNLEMYAKYGIDIVLLLIVGYPTQTEEDHLEEKAWMEENAHFAGNPVTRVEIGGTMLVLPGAPVFKKQMYDLYIDKNKDWVSFPNGETNNMDVRVRRREQIEQWAQQYGFNTGSSYGEGGQLIGDHEKGNAADYQRPQDDLIPLYSNVEINYDDDIKDTVGWENDPTRPLHNNN